MLDFKEQSYSDYSFGWVGTAPATVLEENQILIDVQTVNLMIKSSYIPSFEVSKLRLPCMYGGVSYPNYNNSNWWRTYSYLPLRDISKEEFPWKKPRNKPEWLGLISAECISLGRTEFPSNATSDTVTGTYTNTGIVKIVYDEDIPVMLPPPVKSYIIKGKITSIEKAKPTALPLEDEALVMSDDILEDDLPVQLPPSKTYTIKGKIK